MMEKEKQIEELAEILRKVCAATPNGKCMSKLCCVCRAETVIEAGYHKQSEWISVEERLPDNNTERVLVFLMDDDFTKPIGENKIDTDRFVDGKWVRWSRFVTHWMPLPEPPNMKGDAE